MSLLIDGIIFSLQRQGGISVYYSELFRYLVASHISFEVDLKSPLLGKPQDFGGKLKYRLVPARPFERYRSVSLPASTRVFHSTFYRVPDRKTAKSVVTVHDFVYERYFRGPRKWLHARQKAEAIRRADSIICISKSTCDDLHEFVGVNPSQSVHVIYNGVGACFSQADVPEPVRPFLLFVGKRGGYKNFSLAARALAFLPDFELHCVGGEEFDPSELLGLDASVCNRIRYLGNITDAQLNTAYNQATCLLYLSKYEGFGIPIVEAMKAGCPVVSASCKAVIEVGDEALEIVEEEDPFAVALAVYRLCDSTYRKKKVEKGLSRAAMYDWNITHQQTAEIFCSYL